MPIRSSSLHQPVAVAQLAASLALYGDTQRSASTFQAALADRPVEH